MQSLKRADRAVALVCKWGVITALVALFLLLGANVLTRTFPFISLVGYGEIVEFVFAWMTFLGAVALWREGALYRVLIVSQSTSPPVRRAVEFFIYVLMLVVALVLTLKGTEYALGSDETTPFLRMNKIYWYASVPVCGALMTIYSIAGLVRLLLGDEAHLAGPQDHPDEQT
ncbi:MAG TPA: TRAP transporter small permease [Pararhizobium sp.]|nr:TRAP transporter small permease [Pararhizobium sp.]